jgi:hypothetical protein
VYKRQRGLGDVYKRQMLNMSGKQSEQHANRKISQNVLARSQRCVGLMDY